MLLSLLRKDAIFFYLCKCQKHTSRLWDPLSAWRLTQNSSASGEVRLHEKAPALTGHLTQVSHVSHPCKHTTAVSGAPTSPTLLAIISYLIVKQNLDSTVCISPPVPCPSSLLTLEMILRLAIELNLCLGHLVFRSFFSLIFNVHFVSLPSLTVLIHHPLLGETPYPLPRKVP